MSDLYRRIPKCASSSVSADPQSPSINISAAQAGTGTEVATTEQLTPEMDLPIELDLPAFFTQADFPVLPSFEQTTDPFDDLFDNICEQIIAIVQPFPEFQGWDLYFLDEVISLSLFSLMDEYYFSIECLQGIYLDLITNGASSAFLTFFLNY